MVCPPVAGFLCPLHQARIDPLTKHGCLLLGELWMWGREVKGAYEQGEPKLTFRAGELCVVGWMVFFVAGSLFDNQFWIAIKKMPETSSAVLCVIMLNVLEWNIFVVINLLIRN
jgi:hypothetical protein